MADSVLVEQADSVLVISINRPEARNAVNREVTDAVAAAVDELDERPDLTLGVITGTGGTFCAGMDLKAFLAGEDVTLPGRGIAGIVQRPPRKPLIAAVEGWALAAGCEIALTCDLIVAAEDARFGLPEVKRGLVAGAGGLLRLPRWLPPAIAKQLALTGEPMSAVDAHRFGLVNELAPPGHALAAALELARRITPNGPLAVQVTKQILDNATDWTIEEGFVKQGPLLDRILASEDAREGATAFAEKRSPVWTGR
ncbi:crotonase/enoyl-CoA hydratase family protein [Dactylosporangium sp. AC04546]|uniref:crotonase/enoyl-CoA hydratase family protein n=1 Tax=Dactylosporangium sp. AC04546 TaxID=2862460 RepID=UPI001EDF8D0C|nr:crotonase/enoyl-CoA hydratase family protein [Dactylosporangium sp. AC04546]WVK86961.1 crotonase/enoyl-CoA hydratase family protein [Dactylosporangium sp. AC04546]